MIVNKTFQNFLGEITGIANRHCGGDFTQELNALRSERERLLNNVWKEEKADLSLAAHQQQAIYRDIDFDTIVYRANERIEWWEYQKFLFEIAEISIKYGELARAERLLNIIAAKNGHETDKHLLARTHQKIGVIHFYQNSFETAYQYFEKSLQVFSLLSDKTGVASVKNALGALAVETGHLAKGESLFLEAAQIVADLDLPDLQAIIKMNLGNLYHLRGDYTKAIETYESALVYAQPEIQPQTAAKIYNNIALALISKKELQQALDYLHKSLEISKLTNDKQTTGFCQLHESEVYCNQDDYSRSTALVTSAFVIFSELGDRLSVAETYKILGMINRNLKRFDLALSYFENSKRINEELHHHLNLGETLMEMAGLYRDMNKSNRALICLKSAADQFEIIGARQKIDLAQQAIEQISA